MAHDARHRGTYLIFIGVLGLLTAIAPLSIDMYLPAMPDLADYFMVEPAYVQYSLSLFFLGLAVGQLTYGPLADRYGRRPILFFGVSLYLVSSVVCIFSGSVEMLIAARAVQGFGAAAGPVMSRAVVRDRFQGSHAASVMSFVVMVMAIVPLLAPLIGGFILTVAAWQGIFWLDCCYALLCLLALRLLFAESHPRHRRTRDRALSAQYVGYLALLRDPPIALLLACGGMTFGALFAYVGGSSFVYISEFGVDKSLFGLYFGANVIAMFIGSAVNSRLVIRCGHGALLGVAVGNTFIGSLILLAASVTGIGGLWGVAVPLFLVLSTVGVAGANTVAGLLDQAPNAAGAVSALFGVCQFTCGALSSWLVGMLGGDALAMATVMALSSAGAVAAYMALRRMPQASNRPVPV